MGLGSANWLATALTSSGTTRFGMGTLLILRIVYPQDIHAATTVNGHRHYCDVRPPSWSQLTSRVSSWTIGELPSPCPCLVCMSPKSVSHRSSPVPIEAVKAVGTEKGEHPLAVDNRGVRREASCVVNAFIRYEFANRPLPNDLAVAAVDGKHGE